MQETKVLLGEITAGQQDKRLTDIYVDDKVIPEGTLCEGNFKI